MRVSVSSTSKASARIRSKVLVAEPSDGGLVAFVHQSNASRRRCLQPQMGVLSRTAIVAPGGSVTCITCPDPGNPPMTVYARPVPPAR